ncbi:MAG: AMP-binding protein [Akkermansia sp.]|nr:AMP-binding protein [Akkermansia sp.]
MEYFWDNSRAAERTAIITPTGETYTYEALYALADAIAEPLAGSRKLVFLRCKNTPRTVAAYLGCLRHGHVALLLNEGMEEGLFHRLVELYRPQFIFRDDSAESAMQPLSDNGEHAAELHPDLALLLSTSGSTGSPKLVRLSLRNLQSNAESIAQYLQLTDKERPVTNLPMYYSYGLSVINSHLLVGACLLLTEDSLISPRFWKFCDEQTVTSLSGVPYTYEMLDAFGFRKRELPGLRSMTQAGGHMPAQRVSAYAEWAKERGIRFYIMYGQTEATARMSYLPPEQGLDHPDSIGIPIPGGSFCIEDAEGRSIQDTGIAGELIYQGPNVSLGYAETGDDLSLGDENHGRLHTGDMAKRDENGLYYITGRLKRFLKIAGNRFGLDELESYFSRLGIETVCGGSDGRLLIAITHPEDKDAVAAALKDTWHLLKSQYRIISIERIPRSATGKILYQEIFS